MLYGLIKGQRVGKEGSFPAFKETKPFGLRVTEKIFSKYDINDPSGLLACTIAVLGAVLWSVHGVIPIYTNQSRVSVLNHLMGQAARKGLLYLYFETFVTY